ncbi:putative GARP complex component [Trichodelitschia bisporula]|uniref:Vacuolar protein sorting-associated protein 54 n=1 Tax=Trichodelitschia bisporula TaxID=703511 RepID=A0A6G1I3X6_9PEZI|nr:putative GARP complex component [Trichodelitschia bisporula]
MAARQQSPRENLEATSPSTPTLYSDSYFSNHDWSARPPNRYQPRRGSTASSISSIGGTLDMSAQSRPSAVRDTGQNAISTLLQLPIVRTGLLPHTAAASTAHKPPSTRDIPPVTLTNIPHVDTSAFQPYLHQVGSLFEARARAESEEAAVAQWARGQREPAKEDELQSLPEHGSRGDQQRSRPGSRQGSLSTLSPTEQPQARRRSSGGVSRRAPPAATPLSIIPPIYFEENFRLENPRTFDIVSERSEVVKSPVLASDDSKPSNASANGTAAQPRKALATNAILQEKLSWYLDTVEIHLISSISTASKSFFAALGSLKELHSEAADSVAEIKRLRQDLAQLDKDMAVGGLEIVAMKQRRENLRKLTDAVEQLRCVIAGASHCEELVEHGELETAIDRMAVLEEFTCGKLDRSTVGNFDWLASEVPRQLSDLRRLKALDGFAAGLDQLRARVGKGFESRFLQALLSDLRGHVAGVPSQDTLKRWASASQRSRGLHSGGPSIVPAYLHTNPQLRRNLHSILTGLSRSKYTVAATGALRDAIMREMKQLIRQHLPSSSDDDNESVTSASTRGGRGLSQQDKSAILIRNLCALSPEDAESMLSRIYCAVGEALRRLQVQVKMLLDVTSGQALSSPGTRSPPKSPDMRSIDSAVLNGSAPPPGDLQEELMQALDLSSLLGQAVDVAQTQMIKVLKVRTEQTTHLSPQHFLRYFTLNRLFADECEAVSGRSGAALKGVINSQISEFLAVMADDEKQKLAQIMDADKWEAKDFSDADAIVLNRVLVGMTSDPPAWLAQTHIWEDVSPPAVNGNSAPDTENNSTLAKEKVRSAVIDEEKYILVESVISVLQGIARFQSLMVCIPSISSDVSAALLEYLRLFNSRSCQLVLGAGATRSTAGLKNINTKHMALASQALSFVIALIPYIREFVRRRPGMSGDKTAEFDKVRRLCQDHQVSIHEKLVDIMSTRAGAHISSMRKIDFDADAGRAGASPHMETLTKETATLHRVLNRNLPEISVRMIMDPVFRSYREQWGKAFRETNVQTEAGKERLLRDAEVFNAKLSKIDGAGDIGAFLTNLVREKNIVNGTPAVQSPPLPANGRAPEEAAANGSGGDE